MSACGTNAAAPSSPSSPSGDTRSAYRTVGSAIVRGHSRVQLIGANAFHAFGGSVGDMDAWRLDVAREVVGNMRDTPISGAVFRDAGGAYLYPLQGIVDDHRAHGRVVVLGPFGWDGSASTQFSGLSPSRTPFWYAYLSTLRLWAARFAGQSDVWIEVWNEPSRYDRADGVTDADWRRDMTTLVRTVRDAGNTSIVVVDRRGHDERALAPTARRRTAGYDRRSGAAQRGDVDEPARIPRLRVRAGIFHQRVGLEARWR